MSGIYSIVGGKRSGKKSCRKSRVKKVVTSELESAVKETDAVNKET